MEGIRKCFCLLRDKVRESKRKMTRPLEIQRPLVCAARRMTKALPPVISLYLSELHLFTAAFLVPSLPAVIACSPALALPPFPAALAQYFVLPRVPSFLCSSSSRVIFVPFMPPFLLPSSVTPPPLPILKPPPCVASSSSHLSPLPPSPPLCTPNLPLSYCFSDSLHSLLLCVSSSMPSPQCVAIIARLATAETADSQAVGTGRQREGKWG